MSRAVDFTLRANISDLKSELGRIPGITDKEARKMAGAMEKGLLRAERAAKKASRQMRGDLGGSVTEVIEKFRGLSDAVGISEEKFNSMQKAAAKTAGQVEQFGEQVGQADSSLSAIAGALHSVNPELAEMTRKGADALGAMEGLINAARGGPAVFAATAATIAVLYVATAELSAEAAKLEEKNAKLAETEGKVHKALAAQEQLTTKTARAYGLFTGEIKSFDIALQDSNDSILETAARLRKLQRGKPNFPQISAQINDWADAQLRLNQQIRDSAAAQAMATTQAKIAETQNVALAMASAVYAKTTQVANREALELGAHTAFLNSSVGAYAVTQQATIDATIKQAAGQGDLAEKLEQTDSQYVRSLSRVLQFSKEAEKSTGRMFRVMDFAGNEVMGPNGTLATGIGTYEDLGRTANQTGIIIQDMSNGQILTQRQLIQIDIAAATQARATGKAKRKAARDTAAAVESAADTQIQSTLAVVAAEAQAGLDQANLAAMTTEGRLVELERRALAELDIVAQGLKDRELLTLAAEETLAEARQDIRNNYAAQRTAAEVEEVEEVISIQDRLTQAVEGTGESYILVSSRGVAAMKGAGATGAAMRAEWAAAGQVMDATTEGQIRGLEAIGRLGDMVPPMLIKYGDALEKVQAAFNAVSNEIGAQIAGQADQMAGFFSNVADAADVYGNRVAENDRARAMKVFRIQQGAGISEAVINSSVAITKVMGQLGVFSPLAIAGIVAAGAAQIAVIASQSPSFDVGGVIGGGGGSSRTPDQVMIRALPGEAVLNRETVGRLGADGVDRLNSGGAPQVVVRPVSTFKHFDRFTRAEFRRAGYFRSLFDQDREFAPGQRRY
tara:strand:- start:12786 stop:15329 length:2544 start_codon:yes stop_codon:yes gene_type:complete